MRSWFVVLMIAMVAVIAAARPADACTMDGSPDSQEAAAPDFFTWFDQADIVADVEITATPGFTNEGHGRPGTVQLTYGKAYKGTPPKTFAFQQAATLCGGLSKGKLIGFVRGKQPLGFLGPDIGPALAAWIAATPATRKAVLEKLAKDKNPTIAGAAKKRLAAKP